MFAFVCTSCQSTLKVEAQGPGQKVKCPRCLSVVFVPHSSATSGTAAAVDEAQSDSSSPGVEDTLAGVPPAVPEEIAELLAPARGPGELGWLGPYRVLRILGKGGMGVVFHAEDPQLGRAVALKAILPRNARNPHARQRFINEARAAAGLKHDHIVAIYQVGEDRGIPYQAMEYLEGQSLDQYLKRKQQVPIPEALRIGRDIANGLAEAHSRGLVHRDIKPANIWLERKKETGAGLATVRVKILDFGLARDLKEDTSITQAGMIVGTPAYMAPEQAKAEAVDHRCDLFSLGCLLYRLTTGQAPFRGPNTLAILASLATASPAPPNSIRPDIPESVSQFILKLIEKDPANRPASASVTAETLSRLLREAKKPARFEPVAEPQPSAQQTAQVQPEPARPRIRSWWWAAAAALAGLILIAIAAISIRPFEHPKKEAPPPDHKAPPKPPPAKPPTPIAPTPVAPTPVAPTPPPAESLLGRLQRDKIPAEDLAWAFGAAAKAVPREVVGLVRNGSILTASDARLSHLAISPDGRWLASGGPGYQVDVHDFATGKSHLGARSSHAIGSCFALSRNSLISASSSATLTNRNLLTNEETIIYTAPTGVTASAFASAPDGAALYIGCADGKIHVCNSNNLKKYETFAGHLSPVVDILFRPLVRRLVSVDADGGVIAWLGFPGKSVEITRPVVGKFLEKTPEYPFPKDLGKFRQAALSADGRILFAVFANSQAIHTTYFDRKVAPPPSPVGFEIASFALAPDGKSLAALSPRGQLRVWTYPEEKRLADIALPNLNNESYGPVLFAPDGRHLVIGHPRGAALIVRLSPG